MKYHISLKFLAILLCAACLLVSVAAGIGIFALAESGLYNQTVDQLRRDNQESRLRFIAEDIAWDYVIENLSNLPPEAMKHYVRIHNNVDWAGGQEIYYRLQDLEGNLLAGHMDTAAINGVNTYPVDIYSIVYPTVLGYQCIDPYTGGLMNPAEHPSTTEPTIWVNEESVPTLPPMEGDWIADTAAPGDETYDWFENWGYEDQDGFHQYRLGMRSAPKYTVTLYLTDSVYEFEDHWSWELAEFGYTHRYNIIWVLGVSLLLFAAIFVYLCCAAGRKPKSEEVCPGGLNCLPLDLYAVLAGGAVFGIVILGWEILENSFDWYDPQWMLIPAAAAMAFVACLIAVAFLFACAAQFKMKHFYWAKHSVTGMVLVVAYKLLRWFLRKLGSGIKWLNGKLPGGFKKLLGAGKKCFEILVDLLGALWGLFVKAVKAVFSFVGKVLRAIWNGVQRFARMLPLTWQWMLVGLGMICVLLVCFSLHTISSTFLGIAFCICLVMYGAYCFGILLESTKRMSKGELDTKVEDKLLLGSFEEYAAHLNALADVAVEAAKKQMKSERMKAELVTNVSHDIKTPLTSIINYVDLLQKAENQEQAEEYLEVLNRQSQRLKKLIEDLMEMSKASTGNMAVDLMRVNAVEAINQALGEFSEKLEKAQLTPVFNPPEEPVMMTADGRLTWRVLSNLLGNAVKYALPGTRLYIDLVEVNGQVLISLKNISREQLNVSTEELMERFVRGDASRNTEGSGLGLNIAKSLMELQKGQLQLLVDGDLFKATLIFTQN